MKNFSGTSTSGNGRVRPCSRPPAIEAGKGRQNKEHVMSQTLNAAIAVVGVNIGKNSFHIVGTMSVAPL
jgi:hypothetical protein